MRSSAVTDDGRFSEVGITAGDYLFNVTRPSPWRLKAITVGGREVGDRPMEVTRDITDVVVTLTDRPAEIRGRVMGTTGADTTAAVLLIPGHAPPAELVWSTTSSRFKYGRADTTGAYAFTNVPPGDYLIVAVPDDVTTNWTDTPFLIELAKAATAVRLEDGDKKTQDLRTVALLSAR
jgi:hypothetical protein